MYNELMNQPSNQPPNQFMKPPMMMSHPDVAEVRQIAANQILITFTERADLASALNVSNYWIRGNSGVDGTASLNMEDALGPGNAIRREMANVRAADHTKLRCVMTFRYRIKPGVLYVVLPCYISSEGNSGYKGANWGPASRNSFIGG